MTAAEAQAQHRRFESAVADCVQRSVAEVSIIRMRESPDVDLLHRDGFHVGLEIVRTVDEGYLHLKRRIDAAGPALRDALEARRLPGAFFIYLDIAELCRDTAAAHQAWLREVSDRLASLFSSHDAEVVETAVLQAHGISRVARVERRPSAGTHVITGWRSHTAPGATLVEVCLAKKHQKLEQYRAKNGDQFREYWLAIASFGAGTVEDGGYTMLLDRNYQTTYDRVLLIMRGSSTNFAHAKDVTPTTSC